MTARHAGVKLSAECAGYQGERKCVPIRYGNGYEYVARIPKWYSVMMGRTHALTGYAAGIGATYAVTLSVPAAIVGTVLCAGAALVPDIDHKEATITKTFGPVTRLLSVLVRKISGGHRYGTHSALGIMAIGAMAQYGVMYRHTSVPAQVILIVLMCLAFAGPIRLLRIPGWIDDLAPIPVVIGIVCFTSVPLDVVPPALMLGCAIHVLGDVVTKGGCPLLWPFSLKRFKLDLFKTNGITERYVVIPVVILAIFIGILGKLVDTLS